MDRIGKEPTSNGSEASTDANAARATSLVIQLWRWFRRMLVRNKSRELPAASGFQEHLDRPSDEIVTAVEAHQAIIRNSSGDGTYASPQPTFVAESYPLTTASGLQSDALESIHKPSGENEEKPSDVPRSTTQEDKGAYLTTLNGEEDLLAQFVALSEPLKADESVTHAPAEALSTSGIVKSLGEEQTLEEPVVSFPNTPGLSEPFGTIPPPAVYNLNEIETNGGVISCSTLSSLHIETDEAPHSGSASLEAPIAASILSELARLTPAAKYRPSLDRRLPTNHVSLQPREGRVLTSSGVSTLSAEIVLKFQPGAWGIELTALLRRGDQMADSIPVRLGTNICEVYAISDDLFEPVEISDSALALAEGISAASIEDSTVKWLRSGRDLHIFSAKTGVGGFVSIPRVIIGQENAAVCKDELVESIFRICNAVGATSPEEISGPGIPTGWRCFRNIWPASAAVPDGCSGILLALVPLPDALIDLGGGMPIARSTWLSGKPPSIRILGVVALPGEVSIDGHLASCSAEGEWTANSWNREGCHVVRYAGLSRTYEIRSAPESWENWAAHSFNSLVICGARVTGSTGLPIFISASCPVWLLGKTPGEVAQAHRSDSGSFVVATPNFKPVWAVPINRGRGRNRLLPQLIGHMAKPEAFHPEKTKKAIRLWCQVIREGVRDTKHLHGTDEQVGRLWMQYRHLAHGLWKRSR